MRAEILLTHPCSPQLHDIHVLTYFNIDNIAPYPGLETSHVMRMYSMRADTPFTVVGCLEGEGATDRQAKKVQKREVYLSW